MSLSTNSNWSINLFNINGIPVRMHMSFLVLLAWICVQAAGPEPRLLSEGIFVLGILLSILLHELAHAFTARQLGVQTANIMLYPFGGVASLESIPQPRAELVISLAGPIANFGVALLLATLVEVSSLPTEFGSLSLVEKLFVANLLLAVFNLLPSLPMDGGRVLRAVLALLGYDNHTLIAARFSQAFSLLLAALGFYLGDYILALAAILIFFTAIQEFFRDEAVLSANGHFVWEAMKPPSELVTLEHGWVLSQAAAVAVKSRQPHLPVMHADRVIGLVDRPLLLKADLSSQTEAYISEIMERDFCVCSREDSLAEVLERVSAGHLLPFVVTDQGEFQGLLTRDSLLRFLFTRRRDSGASLWPRPNP